MLYGRGVMKMMNLPTGSVGAVSEMLAAADLLKNGYSVFRAISQACYCDLIAIKGNEEWHIEVRTGYRSLNGTLNFPKHIRGKVNLLCICDRNTFEIHYLTLDMVPVELH